MYYAPRADQLSLLDVVTLDSQLTRLRREDSQHPLRSEISELMNMIAAVGREILDVEHNTIQIQQALEEASARSEELRVVVVDKESRLNAGIGMDSRQLLTLQSEIDTNRQQLAQREETEFDYLQQLEDAENTRADALGRREFLNKSLVEKRSQLEEEVVLIQRDITDLELRRDSIYRPLANELKQAYERAQHSGGLTVIALRPDGTTSGGVALSPIEIAQIRQAEPDQFHISEDYDCIIIRDRDFPLE
ncbi:zinc ribbon domain-containing protein [Arcanobacterium phocae]|uniref:CT398-like coiled coil hairpin domain-containing protein n=1 Tax=Arcanobacterium phocae TaxID=131112 RepID=A0A1H2LKX9_9ACTO|nr:hypothetical protein [Arcanobacterium phocae]SDU81464.1 hypothetical protein SAMN04489737_1525 [Arcanobacterium phocae]